MKNDPQYRRLMLIKRKVELKKKELQTQLKQINEHIYKKEHSIEKLKQFINHYEAQFSSNQTKTVNQFMNMQAFIHQISQTMGQEKEAVRTLLEKRNELLTNVKKNEQQIDTIEATLKEYMRKTQEKNDKINEQINLDQWVSQKLNESEIIPKG